MYPLIQNNKWIKWRRFTQKKLHLFIRLGKSKIFYVRGDRGTTATVCVIQCDVKKLKVPMPYSMTYQWESSQKNEIFHEIRYTANHNILPYCDIVILTYCMAVPVSHEPVSPDSHKNLVKVSWLVKLYVIVLDLVNWHPDLRASEWIGVWANPMKLISLTFWVHHLMAWNENIKFLIAHMKV